ncbi:MAG: hypothetical protein ABIR71_06855 [Chthoniobacterales bacterium]
MRALVPPDATIATPAQRGAQVANLLGGFQLNLTAMSLVSLLVGMFLIYNTVSPSVVRRRETKSARSSWARPLPWAR